jgi:hypothetical protein
MKNFTLAAFGVERRIAAFALFRGSRLEDTKLRHLPLDTSKALGSVRELVTRILERHNPEFIAISCPSEKSSDRIRSFCEAVKDIAGELGTPAVEVDDKTLMCAYGHPPLTRKEYVRDTGRAIWPRLNVCKSKRASVDAALAGLYVQTERLFSLHEGAS